MGPAKNCREKERTIPRSANNDLCSTGNRFIDHPACTVNSTRRDHRPDIRPLVTWITCPENSCPGADAGKYIIMDVFMQENPLH